MENIVFEYIRQYPIIGILAAVIAIIAAINLAKTALQAVAASAVVAPGEDFNGAQVSCIRHP